MARGGGAMRRMGDREEVEIIGEVVIGIWRNTIMWIREELWTGDVDNHNGEEEIAPTQTSEGTNTSSELRWLDQDHLHIWEGKTRCGGMMLAKNSHTTRD